MRISMRKQRRAAGRPGALPNLRRICGHKAGAPTPQKGVRCGRPTNMLVRKRYGYGTPRALWTAVLIRDCCSHLLEGERQVCAHR